MTATPAMPATRHLPQKLLIAAALFALFAGESRAEDAKPDNEFSFNAALTSDYRYRGISQTRLRPALQGGADYVHNPTGLYAGVWGSTIKWINDGGGSSDVEVDLYAGKRGEVAGFTYDVGVLRYLYPSNGLKPNADTTEVYGQLGYGPVYAKYSHSTTNLFGYADSKGSGYLDVGANIDMAQGLVLNLHAGRQRVAHFSAASYTDYKIGVTRDFGVVSASIALIATDADKAVYSSPANGKFNGKTGLVVAVSKVF
jgi:uncharacterized protein (TIGR02001 family)